MREAAEESSYPFMISRTLSWQNDVHHSRSYGPGFRTEFRHLTNVPSFILNRIREKCGAHRNGKCLRINGGASRYLNPADSALDISVDALKLYIVENFARKACVRNS